MQISAFSFLNLFICIYFLLFLLVYVEVIWKSTLLKTLVKFYFNIISSLYKNWRSRRTYLYAHYQNSPIVCILPACYITLYGYIIYIICTAIIILHHASFFLSHLGISWKYAYFSLNTSMSIYWEQGYFLTYP